MQSRGSTKIFVVSLEDAADRRSAFISRAASSQVYWSFFDAHDRLESELTYDEALALKYKGRPLFQGELGCYSSHYSLWKQLLDDVVDQYIILEDDVIVDWNSISLIANTNFSLGDMDYVRLYHKAPCRFIVRKRHFISRKMSLLELTDWAFGTQGYVITKSGAEKFVRYCKRVSRPIDDQMDRFWDHGVPNLCLFPFPILEEAAPSKIEAKRFAAHNKKSLKLRARMRLDEQARRFAAQRRRRYCREWNCIQYETFLEDA